MTREEKIEVMFESILLELERITKALGKGNIGKVQNSESTLEQKFDNLLLKLGALKIPVYKPDLNPIQKKLDTIMESLTNGTDRPIKYPQNQKISHWFFRTHTNKIAWIFSLLFLASLSFNYYLVKDYDLYKQSHLKYRLIYYSGNKKYLHEIDSIWKIDSLRQQRLRFIEDHEREITMDDRK